MIELTVMTMEAVPLNFTDQFALVVSIIFYVSSTFEWKYGHCCLYFQLT